MSHVLTLIADPASAALTPSLIADAARTFGTGPATILSPNEAAALPCPTPPDPARLAALIGHAPIDAVTTPDANRRKRLLVADMDSTIVTGETLDELAAFAGVGPQVAAITARGMAGELDFAAALRERVALLRGLSLHALDQTWAGVRIMPGAAELVATMRAHGATTALVSGGFTWFTGRVAAQLGFHHHRSNTLLDDGTTLVGRVAEPILDRDAKRATLLELAAAQGLAAQDCLAVGDGANDLAMIATAGLGVAYHAKPIVAAQAGAVVRHANLRALLFIQGYRADEFVQ